MKIFRFSQKMPPAHFSEDFESFCIYLITNVLSLGENFCLFILIKKSLQMLNFYFGRKYHFVKLKNAIFACLFCVFKWEIHREDTL